jgi:hypothetical protein
MNRIPIQTESPIVLRTDFSSEPAWKKICAAIRKPVDDLEADVEFVDDPEFQGVTKDKLWKLVPKDYYHSFIFIVDSLTIAQPDQPLLVVDLEDKPGREFRTVPSQVGLIGANLSEANMDFEEFAEAVDDGGVFRGFAET